MRPHTHRPQRKLFFQTNLFEYMNNENVMSKYKTLVIIGNIYREKKTICSILFRQPLTLLHPIQLASQ